MQALQVVPRRRTRSAGCQRPLRAAAPCLHLAGGPVAAGGVRLGQRRAPGLQSGDFLGVARQSVTDAIAASSPVSWQHINLHGAFDFSDDALKDSLRFDIEALLAFNGEQTPNPPV